MRTTLFYDDGFARNVMRQLDAGFARGAKVPRQCRSVSRVIVNEVKNLCLTQKRSEIFHFTQNDNLFSIEFSV